VIVLPVKVLIKICIANADGDTISIVKNKTTLLNLLRIKPSLTVAVDVNLMPSFSDTTFKLLREFF
jgi:hypothetical protein